jgi:hypothetical protein
MLDNHQSLPQYVEHDLEEAQWHNDAWDQTANCRFPPTLSREPRFAQQPDESPQQGPGKYLRHEKILNHNSEEKGKREMLQGILHRNISQTDSTIPTRKELHSSRCTILATRPDTLSSSVDICFIKPQDLLALSKAIVTWRFIKNKQPSRSKILDEYSVHRQEERGGEEALESNISAGGDSRPQSGDPPARTG